MRWLILPREQRPSRSRQTVGASLLAGAVAVAGGATGGVVVLEVAAEVFGEVLGDPLTQLLEIGGDVGVVIGTVAVDPQALLEGQALAVAESRRGPSQGRLPESSDSL